MVKNAKKRGTFKKRRRNQMRYSHKMQRQRGGIGFMIWQTSTDEMMKKLDTADINTLINYINTTHEKIENTENGWKTKDWSQADLKKYDDALNKLISKLTEKYLTILKSTIVIDPSVIIELNTNMKTIYEKYKESLIKQDIKLATQSTENIKKELETIKQSIKQIYNKLDIINERIKRINLLIPMYEKRDLGLDINKLTFDQTIINEVNKITDIKAKIQQLETEKTQLETEKTQLEERQKNIETTQLGGAGNQDTIKFIDSIIREIDNFKIDDKQSLVNSVESLNGQLKTISQQPNPSVDPSAPDQLQSNLSGNSSVNLSALQQPEQKTVTRIVSQNQQRLETGTGNQVNVLAQPQRKDLEMTIDKTKLKELVNKSYVQTMLYLKLARNIISANLKETSDDQNLLNLQTKINNAITDLTITQDEASALNIDTSAVDDGKVNGIVDIMLSLIGMGIISAGLAGGLKTKKYRKGRKYNKKKRQTLKKFKNKR
jgi:hypothetical protein